MLSHGKGKYKKLMNMSVMTIILIILFLIACAFLGKRAFRSADIKGKLGERKVSRILTSLGSDYHVLNNVVLVTDRGTTQIDHIVISPFGVFVVETKNYKGEIYGDDKRNEWTQIVPSDVTYKNRKTYTYITKNHFYNPVKQVLMHLYEIKKNFKDIPHFPAIPIVVFVGKADISHVESSTHVIYVSSLASTIKSYREEILSGENVGLIVQRLSVRNASAAISNARHVANIKRNKAEVSEKIHEGICPKCGGQLVRRTGAYGSFLGCSNYPNCKFTTH